MKGKRKEREREMEGRIVKKIRYIKMDRLEEKENEIKSEETLRPIEREIGK